MQHNAGSGSICGIAGRPLFNSLQKKKTGRPPCGHPVCTRKTVQSYFAAGAAGAGAAGAAPGAAGAAPGAGAAAGAGAGAGAACFTSAGFGSSAFLQPTTAKDIEMQKSRERTIAKTLFIYLVTSFLWTFNLSVILIITGH